MEILKEWYTKSGLWARLYICDGRLFLDHNLCRETTEIRLLNGKVWNTDIPKKYVKEINKILCQRK